MSILVRQTCDGCGLERDLSWGYHGQAKNSLDAAKRGGWIQVKEWHHLCPDCVTGALKIVKAAFDD